MGYPELFTGFSLPPEKKLSLTVAKNKMGMLLLVQFLKDKDTATQRGGKEAKTGRFHSHRSFCSHVLSAALSTISCFNPHCTENFLPRHRQPGPLLTTPTGKTTNSSKILDDDPHRHLIHRLQLLTLGLVPDLKHDTEGPIDNLALTIKRLC